MYFLKELGRLLTKDEERHETKDTEKGHQDQPVPPSLVRDSTYVIQQLFAILIALLTTTVAVKLSYQHNADRIGKRAKVPRPSKPDRDQIWRDKESSEKHLRNKQNREHLLTKFRVLNSATEQHRERSAGHGERINSAEEKSKRCLESNHKVGNQALNDGEMKQVRQCCT
jgi:hypothetical protein